MKDYKEPEQLILPGCEKYFGDSPAVTTGRFNSSEHNESTPPRCEGDSPNGYVVVHKQEGDTDRDVMARLTEAITKANK